MANIGPMVVVILIQYWHAIFGPILGCPEQCSPNNVIELLGLSLGPHRPMVGILSYSHAAVAEIQSTLAQ